MSVLIFSLNGVPDDEAAEVRALLDEQGFDYHETSGGFLGLGVAGLWLIDADQKAAARRVIETYQQTRGTRVRAEHAALRAAGQAETMLQRIARRPLTSLFYLAGAAVVLYLMLWPFLTLGR